MADLGLHELSDDQLLDLLEESCAELAQRDGYVKRLAQRRIASQAEQLKVLRDVVERWADQAKADYLRKLKETCEKELRAGIDSGEIRLNLKEETEAIVRASLDAKAPIVQQEFLDLLRRCFFALTKGHSPADRDCQPWAPYVITPDPGESACYVAGCEVCQLLRDIKARTGWQSLRNRSMQRQPLYR